ncbi:zinc-ribbon and DUF3426 domain-containing protein [Kangiella spongicola]|uniref:Zinc finger/thioredoxin putative domain-containing protein n=1 Tax=Kangiella spongicola TaxID=796379 RepID=A0A318D5D2_9GAMM|nr:zinc-ribbon and DUF3426 domain-containing protein [Kangiella spongicola]PXF64480.1 hypothetical protein DL796_04900 [Kangiella spongicola]
MSETFLTNCPHCKSVFKLRKEHLEVASGHVRCGNCHSLFLATDSLVSLDKESQKAQMSETVEEAEEQVVSSAIPELTQIDKTDHYQLEIEEDTQEITDKPHYIKWSFYGLASLILIYLGFWFFYLWPNQATLGQQEGWRPIYQASCSVFGCQLAPRQDINQYRVNAIEVNITRGGQKEVSMVLKNVADFPQPYPKMRVILSDIKGKQFPSPVYKPQYYLPQVNHNDLIQPNQSVHIAFTFNNEIADYSGYQVELVK